MRECVCPTFTMRMRNAESSNSVARVICHPSHAKRRRRSLRSRRASCQPTIKLKKELKEHMHIAHVHAHVCVHTSTTLRPSPVHSPTHSCTHAHRMPSDCNALLYERRTQSQVWRSTSTPGVEIYDRHGFVASMLLSLCFSSFDTAPSATLQQQRQPLHSHSVLLHSCYEYYNNHYCNCSVSGCVQRCASDKKSRIVGALEKTQQSHLLCLTQTSAMLLLGARIYARNCFARAKSRTIICTLRSLQATRFERRDGKGNESC